jgi:hypothetical protein
MAIIEVQFRKQAFLDYFKAEINRMRLPFPALNFPLLPQLQGKMLEQIECLNCSIEATAGDGQITIQTELAIHYHTSLATIRAAGSLKRAVTERLLSTIPVVLSIEFVPQPGSAPRAQLKWVAAFGLLPPGFVPLDLPAGITLLSAGIEAGADVIAIRLGTRADDPVRAPITSRLANSDWSQLVPGQLIADQLTANLSRTLATALSSDLELSKAPTGAWLNFPLPFQPWAPPFAIAQAEVTAVDQCLFDIDVDVALTLVAQLAVAGPSLVTTLTLTWDADSTLCDIVSTLVFTPIAGIAVHVIAEDKASETILGLPGSPAGFKKIGQDDDSVTYQSTGFISGPSSSFRLTHSEITGEGILSTGVLQLRPLPRGLQGSVTLPASGLRQDCNTRSVSVNFRPAEVYLNDIGMDGPPRLFNPGILVNPLGAWVAVPFAGNDRLELALKFVDPPGGRLPTGTPTSVIVQTDCGTRWVDLGTVPALRGEPTEAEISLMISRCMAISNPWADGIMNLDWLIDPNPPDPLHELDQLRQWTIGARDLPEDARLEFVAVTAGGAERVIGAIGGRRNIAAQVITRADETLQIRTAGTLAAPAPVVSQRWIVPIAALPLDDAPAFVGAAGNQVAVRGAKGDTQVFELAEGALRALRHDAGRAPADTGRLLTRLARAEQRNQEPWAAAAHLDRDTVALAYGGTLIIGTAGPSTRM